MIGAICKFRRENGALLASCFHQVPLELAAGARKPVPSPTGCYGETWQTSLCGLFFILINLKIYCNYNPILLIYPNLPSHDSGIRNLPD
ncbi:MAG TPA: hypothetical protein PLA50_19395, partial [Bacteroidia bacterium]|nr:hypothetical protein [Bacteroidia bacterium]